MKALVAVSLLFVIGPPQLPRDVEAGKARAAAVCAACHGANGVSVADAIPNLAGQKPAYLEAQLRALKDGSRKNPVMNAIASQLSPDDIANVAAYFATQTARRRRRNPISCRIWRRRASSSPRVPDDVQEISHDQLPRDEAGAVLLRQRTALRAAKDGKTLPDGSVLFAEVYSTKNGPDGKPLTGADGFFVADQLLFYTAMAREAGWGKDIPDMLRNEDWNYAAFATTKQPRPVNQAECLACHKPLDKVSYTFTLDQLTAAAKR
jgi:cytochrome c553